MTQTNFFNGNLIGNTFSWSKERNYKKKITTDKRKNILAAGLTDLDGPGGFNGKILLKNNLKEIEIPIESFKYASCFFT